MKVVCTSLDDQYVLYGLVFLDSLFQHTTSEVLVHMLENGLSDVSRAALKHVARDHGRPLEFHKVEPTDQTLRIDQHASEANYFRLALANLFKDQVDSLVYLDADILVTGSIEALWDIDLQSNVLAAVSNPQGTLQRARLQIPSAHGYFNSGVLVIDLKRFDELSGSINSILATRGSELVYWDQDLLNIALEGRWKRLSPIWNLTHKIALMDPMPSWAQALIADARIVHFTGYPKPLDDGQQQHPYFEKYRAEGERLSAKYLEPVPLPKEKPNLTYKAYVAYVSILGFIGKWFPFLGRTGDYLAAAQKEKAARELKRYTRETRELREQQLVARYCPDRTVMQGPFKGLKYGSISLCSALLPKLLGSYESEIVPEMMQMIGRNSYTVVHDVGCAEGYYACGLAMRLPRSVVHAYDTDPAARRECQSLARRNNLSNVVVKEAFSLSVLRESNGGLSLIISDCEGYERLLFSPDDPDFECLETCDLIIECHDFVRPKTTPLLAHALQHTHSVRIVSSVPTHVKAYERLCEGGYVYEDLLSMCEEYRPKAMNWLVCTARCACS